MDTAATEIGPPRALLLLSQYALNFGLLGLRENLIQYLALTGLSGSTAEKPVNLPDLSARLAESLQLKRLHYPDDILLQQLERLEAQGKAARQGTAFYLTPGGAEEVADGVGRAAQVHQSALNRLFERTEASDEPQRRSVAGALYAFLGDVFAVDGERFAKLFVEAQLGVSLLGALPDVRSFLAQSARDDIPSGHLRHRFEEGLVKELESPDDLWLEFLGTIGQCYRILAVLNLAPDVTRLQAERARELFAGAQIYLDTNVAAPLLLPDSPHHGATKAIVEHCRSLGITFLITGQTRQETVSMLRAQEALVRRVPAISTRLLAKVVDLIEEPLVRGYYKALLANPSTKWEYFFARIEEVDQLLGALYGIKLDPAVLSEELRKTDAFGTVVLEICDLFERTRVRPKTWDAAEHDAYVFFHVCDLQARCENLVLFYTADRSLAGLIARLPDCKTEHFAVYHEQLLDLVLPFLRPEVAQENLARLYGAYFSSQLVNVVGRTISISDLTQLLRPWMECDGLSQEAVGRILRRTYVEKVLARGHGVEAGGAPTAAEVDAALLQSLRAEMERAKNAEIERLVAQLQAASAEELRAAVKGVEARFQENLRVNEQIVRALERRGIASLPELAIASSLLPEEVCRGVEQLGIYGLVDVYGLERADLGALLREPLKKTVRVRLSRKGHLEAAKYLASPGIRQ